MPIEKICSVPVGRNPGAVEQKLVNLIGKDVLLKRHAFEARSAVAKRN